MWFDSSVFRMHKYQLREQILDFSAITQNQNRFNIVCYLIYINKLLLYGSESY